MTCKDCIHCEACERMISDTSKMFKALLSEILKMNCDIKYDSTNILSGAEICQCFQDRSRFVELPCSTSEDLFVVENSGEIMQDKVETIVSIGYDEDFSLSKIDCYSGKTYNVSDIGKTIFFTLEEAEQALKEREK